MALYFLLGCFSLFIVKVAAYCSSGSKAEYQALWSIFNSTNGANWIWNLSLPLSTHWKFPSAPNDPCNNHWQGVTCTESTNSSGFVGDCSVSELSLNRFNLSGFLPSDVSHLANLTLFAVDGNSLWGSLPSRIGSLTRLSELSVAYNRLTGSIPSELGSLGRLRNLYLYSNYFSGQMPSSLGDLSSLQLMYLYLNRLSGTLPPTFGQLSSLQYLELYLNYLSGSIPAELGNLRQLQYLGLFLNSLSGTVPPSLGGLTNLEFLFLFVNRLTGTIPPQLGNLSSAFYFDIYDNHLSGSIPTTVGYLSSLLTFDMSYNELTGPLPSELGHLGHLHHVYVTSCHLTGSLPSELSNAKTITQLFVGVNMLTGSLPEEFRLFQNLTQLELSFNYLTGTLSSSFAGFSRLELLNLSSNHLQGDLADLFDQPNVMPSLQYLDLSRNSFSKAVPGGLFSIPTLLAVALYSNCFSGTITSSVCTAASLQELILDSLSSGQRCLAWIPPGLKPVLQGLFPKYFISGTIPSCVWQISTLTTLHFSGNGLEGSLPDIVSSSIKDLNLANNRMTGSIPLSLQTRGGYSQMGLFGNRLTGVLSANYNLSGNQQLDLTSNRLSGQIPGEFHDAANINLLEGNLFQCTPATIPIYDPSSDSYTCGSDDFDLSIILSVVVIGLGLVMLLVLHSGSRGISLCPWKFRGHACELKRFFQSLIHCLRLPAALPQRNIHCRKFFSVFSRASQTCVLLAVFYVVIVMPVYSLLKISTRSGSALSTHTYQYAWVTTSAFLHGTIPIVVFILFLYAAAALVIGVFLVPTVNMQKQELELEEPEAERVSNEKNSRNTDDGSLFIARNAALWSYPSLICFGLQALNAAVVLSVNGSYVLATLKKLPVSLLLFIQFSLGVFKFAWTSLGVPGLMLRQRDLSLKHVNVHLVIMNLFNYVVGPILASLTVDSQCFRYAILGEQAITSTYYRSPTEDACTTVNGSTTCILGFGTPIPITASLTPPFQYSFQCSSSILTNYVPVFMFSFLLSASAVPVILAALVAFASFDRIRQVVHFLTGGQFGFGVVGAILCYFYSDKDGSSEKVSSRSHELSVELRSNPIHSTVDSEVVEVLEGKRPREVKQKHRIFNSSLILSKVMMNLVVMCSFGLACPLLGVVVATDIVFQFTKWRYLLQGYCQVTYCKELPRDSPKLTVWTLFRNDGLDSTDNVEYFEELEAVTRNVSWGVIRSVYFVIFVASLFWALTVFDAASDSFGANVGTISLIGPLSLLPAFYTALRVLRIYYQSKARACFDK